MCMTYYMWCFFELQSKTNELFKICFSIFHKKKNEIYKKTWLRFRKWKILNLTI